MIMNTSNAKHALDFLRRRVLYVDVKFRFGLGIGEISDLAPENAVSQKGVRKDKRQHKHHPPENDF